MPAASLPENEANRILALHGLNILDTPPEERFDRITRLATKCFDVPVALVSLVDSDRQWFKSCQGLEVSETPRTVSFCAHAILQDEVFIIPDARLDPRFADNPIVTGEPHVVFYAGVPLTTADGSKVGTLCLVDHQPRSLTPEEIETLKDLAAMVRSELQLVQVDTLQAKSAEALQLTQFSVDSAPQSMFWLDKSARVLNVNEGACRNLGYDRDELLQMTVFDFDPVFSKEAMPNVWQSLSQQHSTTIESIHRTKDGRRFPVEINLSFLEYEGGEYLFAFATDITKRRQAEKERQRLSQILEATTDWVSMAKPDGQLIYVNRGGREMMRLGLDEDVTTTRITEYYPERQLPFMKEVVLPTVAKEGAWSGENIFLSRDGREIPVLQVVTAQRSADGEVEYIATIVRDITKRKQTEDLLRQTSAVIENSPVVLFRWRLGEGEDSLPVEYVSENIRRFGYTPEELLSGTVPFSTLVHPDDLERIQQEVAGHLAAGVSEFTQEYRLITKDGQMRWTDDRTVVERDAGGKPTHIQGIVLDITERRQAEESLRQSEERLEMATVNSGVGIWDWDIVNETLYWSPQMKAVLGYADDELEMDFEVFVSLLHPDDSGTDEALEAHLKENKPYDIEQRMRHKSGEYGWLRVQGQAIFDDEGQPIRMTGTGIDITKRKQIEESLRISEERLEMATVNSNVGIWDWDIVNETLYWSPQLKAMFGYRDGELDVNFEIFTEMLHPDDADTQAALEAHLQKGAPYDIEQRFLHKSGEYRWFRVRGQAIFDNQNQPLRMAGTTIDITDQKQTEQALAESLTEAEIQSHRLSLLNGMSRELSQTNSKEEIYRLVATYVGQIIAADRVSLGLLTEDADQFEILALGGQKGVQPTGTRLLRSVSSVGHVFNTGQMLVNSDTRQSRFANTRELGHKGVLSTMIAPLISGKQILGTLNVGSTQLDAYQEQDKQLMQQIASLIASILESRQLFDQTQRALAETETLYQISRQLNQAEDLQSVVAVVAEGMSLPIVNRVVLTMFEYDRSGEDGGHPSCGYLVQRARPRAVPSWHPLPARNLYLTPDFADPGAGLFGRHPSRSSD